MRENAEQRSLLARLDGAQRVTGAAGNLGLVMPAPDAVCYLKASDSKACVVSGAVAESLADDSGSLSAGMTDESTAIRDTGVESTDESVQVEAAPRDTPAVESPPSSEPSADPGGMAAGGAN